ncbi:MAG: hypothetical protein WKF54_10240 [Nocardioidaceae bacterium]
MASASEVPGGEPGGAREEPGGEAACWAHLVCPACGRLAERTSPEVCDSCGADPPE